MTIHVHIIAPYASMLSIIEECVPLFPDLHIECSVGDLENGVQLAVEAERAGADIIISRGGTARSIKRSVTVPVIDVQLSGYDMIRSLLLASSLKEKTAIVGFANITAGAQAIIDLLDLPLKAFTVTESREVPPLILELKDRDYKQIAGDVITLKTANEYGLKGFLIQSGRESVRNALEDARLVYAYVHRNDELVRVFGQFLQSTFPNLVVADVNHRIVYARTPDFEQNPLTSERLATLSAKLFVDAKPVSQYLTIDRQPLIVEGQRYETDNNEYTLYTLRKNEHDLAHDVGILIHRLEPSGSLVQSSLAMQQCVERLRKLYQAGEVICLYGARGSGKNFVVDYLHQQISSDSLIMTVDLKQAKLDQVNVASLSSVSTIKLIHTSDVDLELLHDFAQQVKAYKIRLIIIEDQVPNQLLLSAADAISLAIPSLAERQEDLAPLTQIFLSECHQQLGTNAVKVQAAAMQLLQNLEYPDGINGLKRFIKELALHEPDYVIRAETVQKITLQSPLSYQAEAPTGTLKEIEKQVIESVLREENYNQSRTAERLGINRATLWRKLKE
ncbi:sigma-54-dependent Fis family transcriptional regulator [Saccharibacillus sp. JS10]|uniref:sigma-54-dependent Fis family transcriptional regulator n=1 Tax=Saccharibacillus sp. JS10 TaxID=2950552 RepID=UPI00210DC8F8|nr:sigma-54-dependent transcriptional regulator [Saccharibacillus sp. JS10]MCQ4085489.1 PrpR N-terminal domain-containing protein [Saccharibacillus sp. JS10]